MEKKATCTCGDLPTCPSCRFEGDTCLQHGPPFCCEDQIGFACEKARQQLLVILVISAATIRCELFFLPSHATIPSEPATYDLAPFSSLKVSEDT